MNICKLFAFNSLASTNRVSLYTTVNEFITLTSFIWLTFMLNNAAQQLFTRKCFWHTPNMIKPFITCPEKIPGPIRQLNLVSHFLLYPMRNVYLILFGDTQYSFLYIIELIQYFLATDDWCLIYTNEPVYTVFCRNAFAVRN